MSIEIKGSKIIQNNLNLSKQVRTPVALLRSFLDKYPSERYEPPYPPNYRLKLLFFLMNDFGVK